MFYTDILYPPFITLAGLFKNSIGDVSKAFELNITPAGWAFSIWGIIYTLQLAWVVYSLALICRQTASGPAYCNPKVLTANFFLLFTVTSIINISWLFLWDRFYFLASFLFVACQALALYVVAASGAVGISTHRETLLDEGRGSEVKFLNVAVLNGVSTYAAWVTVATLINLGVVLVYKLGNPLPMEPACVICLACLALVAAAYIVLDLTYFERYTRFSFAPYLVVIWALAAVIGKNWNPDNLSSLVAAGLLASVSVGLVVKAGWSSYRASVQGYQYRQMKTGPPR